MICRLGLERSRLEDIAVNMMAEHILENHNSSHLFLSGGSTPGPIYEKLSRLELPWKNVEVGLVDERWLSEDNPGSNASLIRRTLLQGQAKGAKFIPMKTSHSTPEGGQNTVEAAYATHVTSKSFAVLGMGTDGHVCSWFPQSTGLNEALDPANEKVVQAIRAKKSSVTGDYLERMTLTWSALKQCHTVLLLITGQEKQQVLQEAMNNTASDLPVSHLLPLKNLTILHAA